MAEPLGHEGSGDALANQSELALPAPLGALTTVGDSTSHLLVRSRAPMAMQPGGPYMGALAVAKAAQETAILSAMKRQLEGLEEKLGGQIIRVQQQGDRLRDAAMARVEGKVGIMEALQPKVDRRLAELSGNYKGLSDEMQTQIRRIDQMDTRFWDWRHQLEEEVRAKFTEVEQAQKQADSALRLATATTEDSVKVLGSRLKRLENLVEERLGYYDEVTQSVQAVDARLQAIEARHIQDLALCSAEGLTPGSLTQPDMPGMDSLVNSASLAALEAKMVDAFVKIDQSGKDLEDMQAKVEAQEERLRSFRTLMDTKEETYRLNKVDRQDWEARTKELQQLTQELDKHRTVHSEQLEVFNKRFEHHDKAHEEVCVLIRKMQDRPGSNLMVAPMEELSAFDGMDSSDLGAGRMVPPDDWVGRLDAAEDRLYALDIELQTVRADTELGPQVAALVGSLTQVAPKVMANEREVQQLQEKLGLLEARVAIAAESSGQVSDAVARVGQLEVEVGRLKFELEGSEAPEITGHVPVVVAEEGPHLSPLRKATG